MNRLLLLLLAGMLFAVSCKKDDPVNDNSDDPKPFKATPYEFQISRGFPTNLNIPDDNPMTVEGIELGRYLFYDGRLRGYLGSDPDSLMSCGTCHLQEKGFECGIDHPKYTGGFTFGVNGAPTPHVMLPLVNLVFNHNGYLWNGMIHPSNPSPTKRRLEDLVWMGIYAPHEMASDSFKSINAISSIPMYPPMFKAAFGTEDITYDRMSKAIAQFIRTLIASNSKAHKVFRGEDDFTDSERRGYVLFVTESGADCFHCHGGEGSPLFTTNLFYNNAKDSCFTGPCQDPRDRYAFTGNPMDRGAYKATTLINIELTGPYMHDGRFTTLEQVINFYSHSLVWSPYAHPLMHKLSPPYYTGAQLNPMQKADLLAFLKTLTDHTFITNPVFSKPAGLP